MVVMLHPLQVLVGYGAVERHHQAEGVWKYEGRVSILILLQVVNILLTVLQINGKITFLTELKFLVFDMFKSKPSHVIFTLNRGQCHTTGGAKWIYPLEFVYQVEYQIKYPTNWYDAASFPDSPHYVSWRLPWSSGGEKAAARITLQKGQHVFMLYGVLFRAHAAASLWSVVV